MQKWEYTSLILVYNAELKDYVWADGSEDTRNSTERLNELGKDGWELVDTSSVTSLGNTLRTVFFLKRPV